MRQTILKAILQENTNSPYDAVVLLPICTTTNARAEKRNSFQPKLPQKLDML